MSTAQHLMALVCCTFSGLCCPKIHKLEEPEDSVEAAENSWQVVGGAHEASRSEDVMKPNMTNDGKGS